MSRTPDWITELNLHFHHHAYIGDNLPQSGWMNVAGPEYGSYFPPPPHSQPRNFSYAAFPMGSEMPRLEHHQMWTTLSILRRLWVQISLLRYPASASAKIGAKANLTKWREEQSSILVHEWKEQIEVESSTATETWRHILNAMNKVGRPKTIKQCKDKIRNLKQAYTKAKCNNNLTGRSTKTRRYYDSFDEVIGTRAVVTMPGVINSDQVISITN